MNVFNILFELFTVFVVIRGEIDVVNTLKEMQLKLEAYNDKIVEMESTIKRQNENIDELREVTSFQAKRVRELREEILILKSKNHGDLHEVQKGSTSATSGAETGSETNVSNTKARPVTREGDNGSVQRDTEDGVNTENDKRNSYNRLERLLLPQSTLSPADNSAIAFYAYMSKNINVIPNQDLKFDKVITNIGNCYHPSNGIFEAATSGTYVFTWTVRVAVISRLSTELVLDNGVVGSLYVDADSKGDQDTGSTTVVLHVSAGNYLFVRTHATYSSNGMIDSDQFSRSSFSGWKIY